MSGYCDFAPGHPVHGPYHDTEYGFPQRDESALFERLLLEINQAGLSWETILRKREGFHRAYEGFDVDRIAGYEAKDRERLLADPGIIRNRLKVDAAIHNAQVVRGLRTSHGGFAAWLDAHVADDDRKPRDKAAWVKLFKKTFRFTGGEITGEFLMSLGYLPGAEEDRQGAQGCCHDIGRAQARQISDIPPEKIRAACAARIDSIPGDQPFTASR